MADKNDIGPFQEALSVQWGGVYAVLIWYGETEREQGYGRWTITFEHPGGKGNPPPPEPEGGGTSKFETPDDDTTSKPKPPLDYSAEIGQVMLPSGINVGQKFPPPPLGPDTGTGKGATPRKIGMLWSDTHYWKEMLTKKDLPEERADYAYTWVSDDYYDLRHHKVYHFVDYKFHPYNYFFRAGYVFINLGQVLAQHGPGKLTVKVFDDTLSGFQKYSNMWHLISHFSSRLIIYGPGSKFPSVSPETWAKPTLISDVNTDSIDKADVAFLKPSWAEDINNPPDPPFWTGNKILSDSGYHVYEWYDQLNFYYDDEGEEGEAAEDNILLIPNPYGRILFDQDDPITTYFTKKPPITKPANNMKVSYEIDLEKKTVDPGNKSKPPGAENAGPTGTS